MCRWKRLLDDRSQSTILSDLPSVELSLLEVEMVDSAVLSAFVVDSLELSVEVGRVSSIPLLGAVHLL